MTSRPKSARAPHRPEERERLRLALHRRPARASRSRTPARSAGSVCSDTTTPSTGATPCKPRRGVHDVTGDDALAELRSSAERDHRLAGVDPDPHLEAEARIGLVQLGDRLEDPEAGPHRSLRVVLVRHGRTEHRHHRVADELLDRAAEPLDLLAEPGVIRAHPRPHVLGIDGLGRGREPDEVAEQHRDDLPLLALSDAGRAGGQRRRTERTERKLARKLLATGRTRRHRRESTTKAVRRGIASSITRCQNDNGNGRYWARTSDPQLVELVLSQLS